MKNGEWELLLPHACGKNLCSIHSLGFEVHFVIHHALFVVCLSSIMHFLHLRKAFFTRGEKVFSILHSPKKGPLSLRRACHVPILRPRRMGRKRRDNPCLRSSRASHLCFGPTIWEVPKYPRRALHLSGSEARFGGVGKTCPLFFCLGGALILEGASYSNLGP